MKRAKVGDVYCVKVPNGYKLYQWAYSIPKQGDYIRVFNGLYDAIPENIDAIVTSQHSYIISFYASRAYRIGLAQLLGNYPVPPQYPFPPFQIHFRLNVKTSKIDGIHVMSSGGQRGVWKWFDVERMCDLPQEYREITLLNSCVTPNWLLYLFDIGFDLLHPERFFLGPDPEMKVQKYTDMVNAALNEDRQKRRGDATLL